jgi:hypothetical protein
VYGVYGVLIETCGAVLDDASVDRFLAHVLGDLESQSQLTLRLVNKPAKHAYAGGLTTASIAEAAATALGTVAGSFVLDPSRVELASAALQCVLEKGF